MGERKRREVRVSVEPIEGRQLLSSLLIALRPSNVPYLSGDQVTSIASTRALEAATGRASAQAASATVTEAPGSGNASPGGSNVGSNGGVYNGGNNPEGISFSPAPIIGNGTPTAAELAREKFVAHFTGPLATQPGRFTDQKQIIFMRGLGGSTKNFFLHGDYSLAFVIPTGFNRAHPGGTGGDPTAPGYVPPVTGFAFLDDKNNNSGGVVGLDLVADPTSFDAKGRPTRLTFTADPNVYGGIFFADAAYGVVSITYGKNSATALFNGRIYTSGLTSPFENVDLYAKHSG